MENKSIMTKTGNSIVKLYALKYVLAFLFYLSFFLKGISQVGTVPINTPTGGFRIDGYLQRQGAAGDWLSAPGLNQAGSYILDNTGFPVLPVSFDEYFDLWDDNNDDVFLRGKFGDDPNTMRWGLKKSQSKNDIGHCFIYLKQDPTNHHIWLVVAGDRLKSIGANFLDIEFFQNYVGRNADGSFISTGPHGGRTVGDFVISVGFDNKDNTFDDEGKVVISQWQPVTENTFAYFQIATRPEAAFRASNSVSINAPFGAFGSTAYPPGTFAEAAVDLTLIIGSLGPIEEDACGDILSGMVKAVWIKSKSSLGLNANLIDFIEPFILPTNFSASVVANYSYFDLNRAQLSASVSPGTPDDYIISWSPGGAIINGLLNTSITGSLSDIHSYNPVFTSDAGFPCASYIWNVGLIRKSDNCQVGRGRIILRPPCDRIGKPINPDQSHKDRNIMDENIIADNDIKIYPNPSKGGATIALAGSNDYKNIELIDMRGVVVQRWQNVTVKNIQFKDLKAGVYLLKVVTNEGRVTTKKIVVAN